MAVIIMARNTLLMRGNARIAVSFERRFTCPSLRRFPNIRHRQTIRFAQSASNGSWVQWVLGPMGLGSNGSWVQWVLGPMGLGSNGSWVQWVLGCFNIGETLCDPNLQSLPSSLRRSSARPLLRLLKPKPRPARPVKEPSVPALPPARKCNLTKGRRQGRPRVTAPIKTAQ
jgi:hypothetical protein